MEVTGGSQFPGGVVTVPTVIDVNSANPALRVTQRGTGPALLVEDSASVDSSPFIVDANGNVGIGTPTPLTKFHVSGDGSIIQLIDSSAGKSVIQFRRVNGTIASPTIVNSGDEMGEILFRGWDGSAYRSAAQIVGVVNGTPGAADMPGALTFSTTPDGSTTLIERMRINNAGLITGSGPSLGAWTTASPTPTPGAGAFTTATAATRYVVIGKTVVLSGIITITTNGTGSNFVSVPLPFTAAAGSTAYMGTGRESAISGAALTVTIVSGGTGVAIRKYDSTYPGADGAILNFTVTYEAA